MIGKPNQWEIGYLAKDVKGIVKYYNPGEGWGKIITGYGQKFEGDVQVAVLRDDLRKELIESGDHVIFDVRLIKNNQRILECIYKAKNIRVNKTAKMGPK